MKKIINTIFRHFNLFKSYRLCDLVKLIPLKFLQWMKVWEIMSCNFITNDVVDVLAYDAALTFPVQKKVSVIIPVNNSIERLPYLLHSLREQSYKNIEIIAIDSGSNDGTIAFLRSSQVNVTSISAESFTHAYSRNIGAQISCGDYLLFTVDDAVFEDENWLTKAVLAMEFYNIDMLSTPQRAHPKASLFEKLQVEINNEARYSEGKTFITRKFIFRRLAAKIGLAAEMVKSFSLDNTNALVKRHCFFKYGMFASSTCEDLNFSYYATLKGARYMGLNTTYIRHSNKFHVSSSGWLYARSVLDLNNSQIFQKRRALISDPHSYLCSAFSVILLIFGLRDFRNQMKNSFTGYELFFAMVDIAPDLEWRRSLATDFRKSMRSYVPNVDTYFNGGLNKLDSRVVNSYLLHLESILSRVDIFSITAEKKEITELLVLSWVNKLAFETADLSEFKSYDGVVRKKIDSNIWIRQT